MSKIKVLIGALALSAVAGAALADGHAVRMGTEGAYPPYNFINDKGEIDGFERDLGDKLCAIAELECTWVKNDWDSIIPNLVSGNYDVIIAGMSATAERDKVIDFTAPYIPPSPSAYMALAGGTPDLAGGVIAAQVNTIQSGYVAASGATLVEFATPDETIAAVKNGEADAVFADKDYLAPIVKESGGELAFTGEDVSIGGGTALGIRESDGPLKSKLTKAINQLKYNGELNDLIRKWFPDNPPIWQ
ncbi:MAG: transporter substrate-binding domain-containing protein [Pseudomonadota bacterium]